MKGLENLSYMENLRARTPTLRRGGLGGILQMSLNTWRGGDAKKVEPGSFQQCPARGQETMGTNWDARHSVWTSGSTFTVKGTRPSNGTSCLEILRSVPPWRQWKAIQAWFWATSSRRPGLSKGLDQLTSRGHFQHQLFCDSVILRLLNNVRWAGFRLYLSSGNKWPFC